VPVTTTSRARSLTAVILAGTEGGRDRLDGPDGPDGPDREVC